jgi:gamma-glutamylcysteine synthetase
VKELAAKLERSEKAREKAERESAIVEELRQRLHKAEQALSDQVSQQIARENAIITRLETQNRRFVGKFSPLLSSF